MSARVRTIGVLALLASACASPVTVPKSRVPEPEPGVDAFVTEVGAELVDAASRRTDISRMRLRLGTIVHVAGSGRASSMGESGWTSESSPFVEELRKQLLVTLSESVHVLDASRVEPDDRAPAPTATHELVGEVETRGTGLVLALRVVDARSSVILAALRRPVSVSELGQWTRAALVQPPPLPEVEVAAAANEPEGTVPPPEPAGARTEPELDPFAGPAFQRLRARGFRLGRP